MMGSTPLPVADDTPSATHPDDSHFDSRYPLVQFAARRVGPPSTLYVGPDENLLVQVANNGGAVACRCEIRYLLPNGLIQVQEETIQCAATTTTNVIVRLTESFILNLALFVNGAPDRGLVYANMQFVHGTQLAALTRYTLAQGYLTLSQPIVWPVVRQDFSTMLPGLLNRVTVAPPAAGAEMVYTPTSNVRCRPQGLRFILTTSATVANRFVIVHIGAPGVSTYFYPFPVAVTAGQIASFSIGPGAPAQPGFSNLVISGGWPVGLWLEHGTGSIQTQTPGLQVGDQYSAIFVSTEENIES